MRLYFGCNLDMEDRPGIHYTAGLHWALSETRSDEVVPLFKRRLLLKLVF